MSLHDAMDIAATALTAQRLRMELASANMANARTTRGPDGGPYRKRVAVFQAEPARRPIGPDRDARVPGGVRIDRVVADPNPPALRHEPHHPDADENGYVPYPNVNPTEEMVDMLSAARSYEAGLSIIKTMQQLFRSTLSLLR